MRRHSHGDSWHSSLLGGAVGPTAEPTVRLSGIPNRPLNWPYCGPQTPKARFRAICFFDFNCERLSRAHLTVGAPRRDFAGQQGRTGPSHEMMIYVRARPRTDPSPTLRRQFWAQTQTRISALKKKINNLNYLLQAKVNHILTFSYLFILIIICSILYAHTANNYE